MAQVCLRTGLAPSEYQQLTRLQRQAFIDEHNRLARRK